MEDESKQDICDRMNSEENEQVLVERPTCLVPFNEFRDAIAELKIKNEKMVFAYATPQGEKDARSHCYQLRQTKSQITSIHKDAKAKALAECQMIDGEKNDLIGTVEEMINFHMKPIKDIEAERKAVVLAQQEAEQKARDEEEKQRLAAIAEDEAEAKRVLAEVQEQQAKIIKDEEERQAKIVEEEAEKVRLENVRLAQAAVEQKEIDDERARINEAVERKAAAAQKAVDDAAAKLETERKEFEAEKKAEADAKEREEQARKDADAKAEQEKVEAAEKAAKEKQDALDEQQRIADQKEADRIAAENIEKKRVADLYAKEQAEKDAAEKLEAERVADEKHQANVDGTIIHMLNTYTMNAEKSSAILTDIKNGIIPNVTINY